MIEVKKRKNTVAGDYLVVRKQIPGTRTSAGLQTLGLSYPEANQLQAELRRELLAAGVTMMDTAR